MRQNKNKRKLGNRKRAKQDDQYSVEESSSQQQSITARREPKFNQPLTKKPTKQRQSAQLTQKNSQKDRDSSQYDQIDIRQQNETISTHKRPDFLKRWDGVANQIEITIEELSKMSKPHQVYWQIKAKNMCCVLFMEIGKRQYTAFEDDAILMSDIFKKQLRIMSKFLTVSFWFAEIEGAKSELFRRKVPVMILNQVDDPLYRQINGIPKRQIQEIITPAIHFGMEQSHFQQRLIMAIYRWEGALGMVLVDCSTNKFWISQVRDDDFCNQTRRFINKYRPVELIVATQKHTDVIDIAKQICNPYVIRLNLQLEQFTVSTAVSRLKGSSNSAFFQDLEKLYQKEAKYIKQETDFSKYRTVKACFLIWKYLQSLSLTQKIFSQGLFDINPPTINKPFFDSQVYENIEVFRIKNQEESFGKAGTLIGYLDHCQTLQGKKLLNRWIDQPLKSRGEIFERQASIQQLFENISNQVNLTPFEKMQKRLGDVYHWTLKQSDRGRIILTKNIKFEKEYDQKKNPAIVRLKEMHKLLLLLQQYQTFLQDFQRFKFKSELIRKISRLIEANLDKMDYRKFGSLKGMPKISPLIDKLLQNIEYNSQTEELFLKVGYNEVYDQEQSQINRISSLLEQQLEKWRRHFGNHHVSFASVRAKRQIQVPKSKLSKHQHEQLIFSSQTSTCVRYITPTLTGLCQELLEHQIKLSQVYQQILEEMVIKFCQNKYIWDLYVQSSAKLDVLLSLAKAAEKMPVRCLPTFDQSVLSIKNGHHAGLLQVKQSVVPNTVTLRDEGRFMLLSGPNMGGKSTFLKQTCLLAIMAQIGCFVPAEEYCCPVFDQIFCRIGASDRIYEGKSTFYVELEETKRILSQATKDSLIIIDELGRGTSTFDGMAIAESIIWHIINKISAFTLFSTHYTYITNHFRSNPQVKLMKMCYELSDKQQKIFFTYQLIEGVSEKSFASNVGKMVGLHGDIIEIAERKAEIMREETKRKNGIRQAIKLIRVEGRGANGNEP